MADADAKDRLLNAHCEVAARLAGEMGLPVGVSDALAVAYARWDGRGIPGDVAGEAIPLSMRVAVVARDIELWGREAGAQVAAAMLRRRRGRAYAPEVVDAALAVGVEELRSCDEDAWDVVLALEPEPWAEIAGPQIRRALAALGDFADLKAPEFAGHARRVERVVVAAGEARGLAGSDREILARAALVHDVGVVAVPSGVWCLPRRLSAGEWEQVRLHPMWSERILTRCSGLEAVAAVAGRHHERADGSGYPAGTAGNTSGLLACADLFVERTSPRPYRPAQEPAQAADDLRALAAAGALIPADSKPCSAWRASPRPRWSCHVRPG